MIRNDLATVVRLSVKAEAQLGLWHISETAETMLARHPSLTEEVGQYHNEARKQERIAVYELLFLMTGDDSIRLAHDSSGRPIIPGWQVSISHTRGYAAVILARQGRVGVDIEYRSNRVSRIASRFLRDDEQATMPDEQLLFWCAKETTYKYFSEQALELQEMKVHDLRVLNMNDSVVRPSSEGTLSVTNLRTAITIPVFFRLTSDYCLTYALENYARLCSNRF